MVQSRVRALTFLAALACVSIAASTALAGSITHTTGLAISKSCPPVGNEGETITCAVTIENEDPDHGLNVSQVTNQFPFPCAGLTCPPGPIVPIIDCTADGDGDGAFFLGPNDGDTNTGADFTSCTTEETLNIECTGTERTAADQVVVEGTDADPILLESGGFGGLPVSGDTTNSVIVICNTPTPTATGTPTPTSTPTPTNTRTPTNTPEPTSTVPPIPAVPSPFSPGGILMVGALGLALLWALRRIATV